MFFENTKEKPPTQVNESERRRSTDTVLNQTTEILDMSEVQDALERLGMGHLPGLLQRVYVPEVENGRIEANKSSNFIPIVSLYPGENLYVKDGSVSLDVDGSDGLGITIDRPQTLVGLSKANSAYPTAPMTAIHELAHVHQVAYNTVNDAAHRRYPHFGDVREAEALNVEAAVADVLMASRDKRWANNRGLLTPLTAKIRSRPPAIPYKKSLF